MNDRLIRILILIVLVLIFLFGTGVARGQTNDKKLDLSWQDNSNNETHWVIERSLTLAGPFTAVATIQSVTTLEATPQPPAVIPPESIVRTGYTDMGLGPNTVYVYRVRASNDVGASGPSNVASAKTGGSVPPAIARPIAPSATKVERTPGT